MKASIVFTFLILSSCASTIQKTLGTEDRINKSQVSKIKKVAIAAFVLKPAVPSGVGGKIVGELATAQMVQNAKPEQNPKAIELYNHVSHDLEKELSWKILPLSEISKNTVFMKIANEKIKSYQGQATASHLNKTYVIPNIPNPWNTKFIFSDAERAQILQALAVDAILIIGFQERAAKADGFLASINPLSSSYLSTNMFFFVFDKESDSPIWQTNNYSYENPEELGRISGLEDKSKMELLTIPTARETLSKFIKKSQSSQ